MVPGPGDAKMNKGPQHCKQNGCLVVCADGGRPWGWRRQGRIGPQPEQAAWTGDSQAEVWGQNRKGASEGSPGKAGPIRPVSSCNPVTPYVSAHELLLRFGGHGGRFKGLHSGGPRNQEKGRLSALSAWPVLASWGL